MCPLLKFPAALTSGLALLGLACGDGTAPLPVDTTPPTVELNLSSNSVSTPGDISLVATTSDNLGVTKVEFYERVLGVDAAPTKIGEDSSEPYGLQRPVLSPADNGSHEFTAKAYDAAGNIGTSNTETAVVSIEVTAPAFTLSTSHDRITTPGQIILTAESDKALARVEIYDRGTKVGESVGTHTPQQVSLGVSSADNGAHTYVARGYDAADEAGFSNSVTVMVDIRWDVIQEVEGLQSDDILPLASDPSGAVYLGGTNRTGSEGSINTDVFLAKYDSEGNRLWKQSVSTPEGERTYSVGVDPSGRAYVTGFVSRPRDEDADVECLLVVYTATGSIAWTASPREGACVAATDASGSFYLARSVFATDIFLTKLDPNGQELWTRQFGTRPGFPNDDVLTSIVVDPGGGVYVSGYTSGSLDGGPNRGGRDVFVVKFDQAGNNLWARQFGTSDHDFGSGLAADPDGGVYVAGGKDHPEFRFGRFGDALIARYSSEGSLLWVRHLDGGFFDDAWSVAADRSAVYLVGRTTGAGSSGELSEVRQGPSDGFLAKLSRDGGLSSVRLLGGPQHDGAFGVALGSNGDVFVSLDTEGGLPGVPNASAVLARHREPAPP
jgi:hypothetical protein